MMKKTLDKAYIMKYTLKTMKNSLHISTMNCSDRPNSIWPDAYRLQKASTESFNETMGEFV